jgi:hypothetical protein
LSSLYQTAGRHRSWLRIVGPALLAAILATGCSASSSTPAPSPSGSAAPAGNGAFRQCLQKHGVTLPSNRQGAGIGQPHARPTGAASSAFRQALQACGGFHGAGGSGPAS